MRADRVAQQAAPDQPTRILTGTCAAGQHTHRVELPADMRPTATRDDSANLTCNFADFRGERDGATILRART
jgi:hypothetical protein